MANIDWNAILNPAINGNTIRQPVYLDQAGTTSSTTNAPAAANLLAPATNISSGTKGGLGGMLGTQNADPTRNIGVNPDGTNVPVNHNPDGYTYGTPNLAKGAGQAPVAAGAPDWARFTGGHTGSSYNITGFNPWQNLAQYNGGQYATAGGAGEAPATSSTPGGEDDINRVFRWTNDILKAQGIGQNDPRAAQIFAANVERLKSEYAANKADWSKSRFARFGNPAQQSQTATPPAATPPAAGQTGGTPVVINDPSNPNYTGTNSNPPPTPNPGAPSVTGQGAAGANGYAVDLANSKALRQQALYAALGIGDPAARRTLTGAIRSGVADKLFEPWMQTQGVNGGTPMDGIQALIQKFAGDYSGANTGGFYGNIQNDARHAVGGIDWSALDDADVPSLLSGLQSLMTVGGNSIYQKTQGNRMDDALSSGIADWQQKEQAGNGTAYSTIQFFRQHPEFAALVGLK